MDKFIANLKAQAEANPMLALGVGAAFTTSVSKLLNAQTQRRNAKSWSKEVDRRTKKSR